MSIFYKITTPSGKISYLFGTFHCNDIAVVTLPREVKKVFEEAMTYVFEMDVFASRPSIQADLVQKWRSSQTQHLSQIPEDYIAKAKRHFKRIRTEGIEKHPYLAHYIIPINCNSVDGVSPIMLAQDMLSQVKIQELIHPLDQRLITSAKKDYRKKIVYLELEKDQAIDIYGHRFNILEQIEFYRFIESELAKGMKFPTYKDLKYAYQQQDTQKLNDLIQTASEPPEIVHRYYDAFFKQRDLKMAKGMKPSLDTGNAFIAVGVAHLKGIAETLQTEGYKIEAVPLGKRHYPIEGTIEDGEKVAAFRKIYTALYMAQTSLFKKRGFVLTDDEVVSLPEIQAYIKTNNSTRSYKAWKLAEEHYKDISSTNSELLKSICQEGYAKSSSFFGLFKRTKTNLDDAQSVASASPETRTGTVRDILNGASI